MEKTYLPVNFEVRQRSLRFLQLDIILSFFYDFFFQTIELDCGPICDWFVDNKRRPVNYQAGNMARTRCHALVDGFWKTQMPIEKVVALLPKTVEAMSRTVVVSSSFWNILYYDLSEEEERVARLHLVGLFANGGEGG